jgi:hypothetical protein
MPSTASPLRSPLPFALLSAQVLFLEDDSEPMPASLAKLLTADQAHPEKPFDKSFEPHPASSGGGVSSALRPSTLLHHAFSRSDCPATLSPPCDQVQRFSGCCGPLPPPSTTRK